MAVTGASEKVHVHPGVQLRVQDPLWLKEAGRVQKAVSRKQQAKSDRQGSEYTGHVYKTMGRFVVLIVSANIYKEYYQHHAAEIDNHPVIMYTGIALWSLCLFYTLYIIRKHNVGQHLVHQPLR